MLFGAFLRVSLFLALVCYMAPKRKSIPSQNPLCSGTSISSDTTPSHVRFCDDKAWKDFSENFSRRGIHLECQVILSDFSDTDFPTVIYSWGWELLCGIPITCPPVIIQEFYSNMNGFDYSVPQFITCVWGTRFVVIPDIVFEVLHVPRVAHPNYPGCDRLKTCLKMNSRLSFVRHPHLGVIVKTPLAWALQMVQDSLTWW